MEPIRAGSPGTCPHCLRAVHFVYATGHGYHTENSQCLTSPVEAILVHFAVCPSCYRLIVSMQPMNRENADDLVGFGPIPESEFMCWPLLGANRPIPPEVPAAIAEDYRQAALVLNLTPELSAAASRRCLQAVLREQGYTRRRLVEEIEAAKSGLPSYVADDLDHIREIGNFGAHPNKDTNTGEIIDVEPGEADWNLHVLDLLFDHYYVRPAKAKQMREAAKAKVQAART